MEVVKLDDYRNRLRVPHNPKLPKTTTNRLRAADELVVVVREMALVVDKGIMVSPDLWANVKSAMIHYLVYSKLGQQEKKSKEAK